MRASTLFGLSLALSACASEPASMSPPPDPTPVPDAGGAADADLADSGVTVVDAAVDDAGFPDSGDPNAYRDLVLAAEWQRLPNAPSIQGKQDDVYFLDPLEGFSVNGEGRIFHTSDGGEQWAQMIDQPGTFFRSIMMLSPVRGFAGNIGPGVFPGVTDPAPLYETRDGATWTVVDRITGPAVSGICNMQRLDDQHLYAVGRVGGPAFMISSSDGGETWRSRDLNDQLTMLIDVRFTTPLEGILIGRNARGRCAIVRTQDGGESWTTAFESAEASTLCWKLSFPSPLVGYASIQGGRRSTFAKTVDGGATWQELPLLMDRSFRGLGAGFITEDIGWMANETGAWRTTDGGATWARDPSLGPAINRFRFVDRHTAYAIGTTIYKLQIPRD